MQKLIWIILCFAFLLLLSVSFAFAQSADCPAIVQTALQSTDAACQTIGRNQVCYGNGALTAEPKEGVSNFSFDQVGDVTEVAVVKRLQLSALNTETSEWGIVLMRLQANLDDTVPGQNVTVLVFGDVEIENAGEEAVESVRLDVTAASNANVRATPSTGGAIVSSLTSGQTITATGRLADSSWIRIELEGGLVGWVASQLVTGDIAALDVADPAVAPSAAPAYGPMQAFYFKTGIGAAPCAEAPQDGILIQTPEGVGQINLAVNGVDIRLGSTAYLQAAETLAVNIVEGQGLVSSAGISRSVPAGSRVQVPLRLQDDRLVADGPPGDVEPYDIFQSLPLNLLEREITVAVPLTLEEIEALSAAPIPVAGQWIATPIRPEVSGACPPGMADILSTSLPVVSEEVTMPEGGFDIQALFAPFMSVMPGATFSEPEPGIFVVEGSIEGSAFRYEFRVQSPIFIESTMSFTFEGCTIIFHWEMTPVNAP